MRFAWGGLAVWAALVGFVAFVGLSTAPGAPQEAAVGAMACTAVIVPYVLLRALDEAGRR